jgi:hypothetical protein
MVNVVMLRVVMLYIIVLSGIMLSVLAPFLRLVLKTHLGRNLSKISVFQLARLVVDVDDGGDEGEGGEEQEEQGLDAKAGRGTARLVGTRLPGLGAVQLWNGKVLFC